MDKGFKLYTINLSHFCSGSIDTLQASVDNINTEYKVATSQNLPTGNSITSNKQIWSNDPKESGYILGITVGRNKNWWEFLTKGEKSTVLIAPNLGLKTDYVKQAIFGHEYIHAYHRYIGLVAKYGSKYSGYTESSAYDFSGYLHGLSTYGTKFPRIFNWRDAIKNIINFKK